MSTVGHTAREEIALPCGCVHALVADEALMPAIRPCAEHPQREIAPSWDDILDETDDDFDPTDPVGLKAITAERVAAELADIAWYNRYGWPSGGS